MGDTVFKLIGSGTSEVIVKKSRFLGITFPIETPEEAAEQIAGIRKKYYDARHNCYAYRLPGAEKFSDDGEPSQTAHALWALLWWSPGISAEPFWGPADWYGPIRRQPSRPWLTAGSWRSVPEDMWNAVWPIRIWEECSISSGKPGSNPQRIIRKISHLRPKSRMRR